MSINLRKLLVEGHTREILEHKQKGLTETGRLRGGNTGYIGLDGEVRGQDARKALARYYGISTPVTLENSLMFQGGLRSEDSVMDILKLSSWDGEIYTQKEMPVEWEIDGVPVTGSPDFVLAKEGKPVFGIEKKLVSAYNTASKVGPWFAPSPKLEHVAQAVHYSVKLGNVPWAILYASRVNWDIPIWDRRSYPEEIFNDAPELVTKLDKRTGKIVPAKLLPFYSIFYLDIHDGIVFYKHEHCPEWVDTDITVEGIDNYYQLVVDCIREKKLPPRYAYEGQQYWDAYSPQYNEWAEEHELYDSGTIDYDTFLDLCKTKGD